MRVLVTGDMTEREQLLRAVCADPADDTVRLAFADWLDEHGDESVGDHAWAEFIRLQIEGKDRQRQWELLISEDDHGVDHWCRWVYSPWRNEQGMPSRENRQSGSAVYPSPPSWDSFGDFDARYSCGNYLVHVVWSRGFVSWVKSAYAFWREHHDKPGLFDTHPITKWVCLDKLPDSVYDQDNKGMTHGWQCGAVAGIIGLTSSFGSFVNHDVHDELTGAKRQGAMVRLWSLYPSAGHAMDDLSAALVSLGRRAVGLPPLRKE